MFIAAAPLAAYLRGSFVFGFIVSKAADPPAAQPVAQALVQPVQDFEVRPPERGGYDHHHHDGWDGDGRRGYCWRLREVCERERERGEGREACHRYREYCGHHGGGGW